MEQKPVSLEEATGHILEECRMVLPGIQALFGFQLIAVFDDTFHEKLAEGEQLLHLAAIVLVTVAIALVMAPAALHRQAERYSVSRRFIDVSSRLLLAGMFPLAIAIALEVYLVASVIFGRAAAGWYVAAALLAIIAALWVLLPAMERRRRTNA
jgi:hypothetical protein